MSWSTDDPRLTLYLLGDLSPEEVTELEALLPQRPDLREVLDELRPTLSLLEEAFSTDIPDLPVGLNDIQKERVIAKAAQPERTDRPSWFMQRATSIAAVLVLFAGVGLVVRNELTTVAPEPYTPDTTRPTSVTMTAVIATPVHSREARSTSRASSSVT